MGAILIQTMTVLHVRESWLDLHGREKEVKESFHTHSKKQKKISLLSEY